MSPHASIAEKINRPYVTKQLFYTCIFILFLTPYSLSINNDGVSANYLFMLFPVVMFFISGKVRLPGDNIILMIVVFVVIFFISFVFKFDFYQYAGRRIASFVVFMSLFSYMLIKIDSDMVRAFKLAIVLISAYFILIQIHEYLLLSDGMRKTSAKGLIGSQRYGFVYLFAFWIIMLYQPRVKILNIAKLAGVLLISAGLLLTYSRSSVVALLASLLFYVLRPTSTDSNLVGLSSGRFRKNFILMFLIPVLGVLALIIFLPDTFIFYKQRLFSLTASNGEDVFMLSNPDSSEGYRIFILQKILEFVSLNPFTGSGYLGVWAILGETTGSSHNQYTDVLLRTGVFGFIIYILLLLMLLRYLRRMHPELFLGLFSVLIYGLFHETFKLSQGAFILAFLFGMFVARRNTLNSQSLRS